MSCNFEGYNPFSYLGHIGESQVFGWSDIAEVIRSCPGCKRPANTPRDMVIPYANIEWKGARDEQRPMIGHLLVMGDVGTLSSQG